MSFCAITEAVIIIVCDPVDRFSLLENYSKCLIDLRNNSCLSDVYEYDMLMITEQTHAIIMRELMLFQVALATLDMDLLMCAL